MMQGIRRVMQYGNLSYEQALDLPTDVFLLMAKNHYVDELQQTETGREYLEKCKRLRITEIDEQALRSRYDF